MRDPQSDSEWREAVDLAEFLSALDACRQYGLLTGGPIPCVERCQEILKRGKELGFTPGTMEELVEKFMPGRAVRVRG